MILLSRSTNIEFYSNDKITINKWYDAIKDNVIILDLKEDYTIYSMIGKGNFAKVHLCKKKLDDSTYALKSIEKNTVKKN